MGFQATTIDRIVKRADVNRTTFYLHFKDKVDVAFAIGQRYARKLIAEFKQLDALDPATSETVSKWVSGFLAMSGTEDMRTAVHVFSEAASLDSGFASEYAVFLERVSDRIMRNSLGRTPASEREIRKSQFKSAIVLMTRYTVHTSLQKVELFGPGFEQVISRMLHQALFECRE